MACPTCGLDVHEYHDGPRECVIALLAKLAAAEKEIGLLKSQKVFRTNDGFWFVAGHGQGYSTADEALRAAIDGKDGV